MAKKANPATDAIVNFFAQVREDPGLQGKLMGKLAEVAPEVLAKIAGEHGHNFSHEDLKQLMEDRAQRSLKGDVFWNMVLGQAGAVDPERRRVPFIQINGPSWVQQAPYRKTHDSIPVETVDSLSELLREIDSETR